MNRKEIEAARSQIDHGCDGPITPFVLIARACNNEAMANALYEALVVRRWLNDGPHHIEITGS